MKKSSSYLFHCLALLLMLSLVRCANVVSPTGGPKDTVPPIVLHSTPQNQATNFSDKEIHITFDEYVTLNNPNKNILISPPLDNNPEYKLSGKSLIIKFKESLKPDVTYSINFGEAIKDLHEGNVFKDYSFVLSTGENIDTLTLQGKVLQAFDHKPSADFFVMLYTNDNDSVKIDSLPYLSKPYYITKTDKDGNFKFSGLKNDEYLIFALKDGNSNLKFDLPNEDIAFIDSLVCPIYNLQFTINNEQLTIDNDSIVNDSVKHDVKESTTYTLYSFLEEDSIQRLLKKEVPEEGVLRFAFRYPAKDVKIEILETLPDTFAVFPTHSMNYDTITWYFSPNKDSLSLAINYDTLINDTSAMSLKVRKTNNRRNKKEETVKSLNVATNVSGGKLAPEQNLILSFKEPVTDVMMRDTSWYIVDKDTIINDLHFEKIDSFGLKYKLDKTFEPEKSYKIIIPDSVFFSFKGLTNDTTEIMFKVPALSEYGNIFVTVEKPDDVPQVIVELLDERDKLVRRHIITTTSKVDFKYLAPKKYKLKALFDRDGNGRWSPGDFGKKQLPEEVFYHKDVFDVKANWDIDLEEVWKF
ncbi:MAG: Ig-like domain-containing protein [Bacteroidales bacterium]|nr:Ig-like domain-containing protein [Bacteroidales bacterium]